MQLDAKAPCAFRGGTACRQARVGASGVTSRWTFREPRIGAARILLVCWATWDGDCLGKDLGLLARPAASAAGIPGREVTTVTITDIGILLIVLCIALWAIMAALHRHTVQLEALKSQMQELLKARETDDGASAREANASAPSDRMEASSAHAPAKPASVITARQSVMK